ncbi:thiamine pyrophosphate-binding protein [Kribbella sp. NPDC049227]|uniref:thiamine pyrophosphate-binding protein n=1 Tax=Kribbella sp. NPDC049227 TaxID=3364113 RepID=UPI00371B365F
MTRAAPLSRDLLMRYLEHQGVEYIFGNPGTTELPFVDACDAHPTIRYVLSLHEDVAVAQATGYARASGKIGVVNLHVAPGLAHGLGNLYNAFRARVPLLVTAGQQHTGLMIQDPILTADLAGMVRPFTKWAYEVTRLDDLPIALQRAFKELTTPPYGPVFLSFPMNMLLEEQADLPTARISRVAPVCPDQSGIDESAAILSGSSMPIVIAGDGVGHSGAWDEITALAEAIGAPIYSEGYSTLWNCPSDHPLFCGPMPNQSAAMRNRFEDFDTAVLCGVTSQAPVSRYDNGGPLVPWRLRTIAVDDSPWEIGKNQPVEVGLIGEVKGTLGRLVEALHHTPVASTVLAARTDAARVTAAERIRNWESKVETARSATTISPTLVAAELRDLLPDDAVFVDESISNRPSFVNVLRFGDPLSYFAANGLSLGYSAGVACGIKMAQPQRQVVNVVGDGSLMYYPQALWNAAHEEIPVLFVVLNNGEYRVLKQIVDRMGGPWGESTDMPVSLNIEKPAIDFVNLARSLGLEAERVSSPAELRPALTRGIDSGEAYLVEVIVEQTYRESA